MSKLVTARALTVRGAGIVLAAFSFGGCSATNDDSLGSATSGLNSQSSPHIRDDSVVAREGLPRGDWRYWGRLRQATEEEIAAEPEFPEVLIDEPPDGAQEPQGDSLPQLGSGRMAIVDDETGDVYSVAYTNDELETLTNVLEKLGFAEENFGDIEHQEEDDLAPKSWVNGTDNRWRFGIHESGTTGDLARVGLLTGPATCTATFVGTPDAKYYVITAAHCLFTAAGAWWNHSFAPRRDACRTPTGATISGCVQSPYGTWTGGQWMTYQDYLDNCRTRPWSNSTYCAARDIAVIRVSRPSGVGFPGAHGFGVYSPNTTPTLFHRGYPGCWNGLNVGAPDAPGGSVVSPNVCSWPTVYGRSNGQWGNPFENQLGMAVNMSVSPGHSGGPYWVLDSGAKVAGVHSGAFSNCSPVGNTNCARPAAMARITSTFYSWMLSFMGI